MEIEKLNSYRFYIYDYNSLRNFDNFLEIGRNEDEKIILSIRDESFYCIKLFKSSLITEKDFICFLTNSAIVSPITNNLYRITTFFSDDAATPGEIKKNVKNLKLEIVSLDEDGLSDFLFAIGGIQDKDYIESDNKLYA